MKHLIRMVIFVFFLVSPPFLLADIGNVEDLLEIPEEYREKIEDRLKESKEYTEEQIETITECLDESSIKGILNCFSNGGIDQTANILILIRDELLSIEERICGESTFFQKDKCEKVTDNLDQLKKQFGNMWSTTMERGKEYIEKKNELIYLKRKICKTINQEGCWGWLNERLELKCNLKKLGSDPYKQEKCQLDVATDVWERLNH